ncbi:MAG: 2-oxo acid dehydrogenase subunit E2 [Anaerolineaceae bacterium]|jgi:pyruvate dehydrogenase E2 component (dihydrolipoamide acetyltransferase)|nr:2-oxo acid dehydrogenase subunit E2 [Anaerolineaceae bacterium]
MAGVDSFNPLINPPEAGILGINRFVEKEGSYTATFSLTFDHRVIDVAPAAQFLQRMGESISVFK